MISPLPPSEPVKVTIRRVRRPDVREMIEIEKRSFPNAHWDEKSFLTYDSKVAEVEHKIAGFLVSRELLPSDGTPGPEREILNLAVDPPFRGLGIAKASLEHELRRGGTFFLEVRESNVPAQRLYAKYGFVEIGRRLNYYHSPIETAIVMRFK